MRRLCMKCQMLGVLGKKLWYNKVMPKRLIPVLSLISAIVLLLMLNFTTPVSVGPFGVFVFFLACYMLVLGVTLILVKIFTKLAGKQMGHKGYMYAAVIAFGPIMLLLVQSLGSLSPVTIGLVVAVVLIVCFLISKRQ